MLYWAMSDGGGGVYIYTYVALCVCVCVFSYRIFAMERIVYRDKRGRWWMDGGIAWGHRGERGHFEWDFSVKCAAPSEPQASQREKGSTADIIRHTFIKKGSCIIDLLMRSPESRW